ncbi:Thiamine-phosphate synthase [Paraconexibacter sp. AEG42_29]|uniref:Thiamine-phosphate synthase n=1 Tax=Paraconexibacter sp. AEG42_29 TaxID=2997339 RepID=A0AAU7AP25_9ACTN
MDRRSRLQAARLYLVTPAIAPDRLHAALAAGVDIVQLRIKTPEGDDELLREAAIVRDACAAAGALFVLNDRPDLVRACGADGVHVGQDDLAIAAARALVGPDRIVGLSTHSPAQIDAAHAADGRVDYIGVGPVHATPTKPGRAAVGLDLVTDAAARATLPFFAIGGVDSATVAAVRAAGATRVAVVRAVTEAADPAATVRELRAALGEEARVGIA